jgi:hypothetical protein
MAEEDKFKIKLKRFNPEDSPAPSSSAHGSEEASESESGSFKDGQPTVANLSAGPLMMIATNSGVRP